MQPPIEREFLQAVLREIEGLPPALAQALSDAVATPEGDRAEALRRLFEEAGRG